MLTLPVVTAVQMWNAGGSDFRLKPEVQVWSGRALPRRLQSERG